MTHEEDNTTELPESLIAELKHADGAPPLITVKVDRAISDLARDQFSSRPRRHARNTPKWFAAAAAMLLAVFLWQTTDRPQPVVAELYRDVDQSGQIDIADVFALARRGGGAVTRAELDAFAMQLVSLEGGDRS